MPETPPLFSGLKARLARTFLNFLDEHGDYRSALEEAAARAAAAEANSLWARDRRGRKKKKKKKQRGNGGGALSDDADDDDDDDLWEELDAPFSNDEPVVATSKHPPLPEDPYEQIQFYFATFTQRTKLQIREQFELYQMKTQNWLHDELHHVHRVPFFSASMLLASLTLYTLRVRSKKVRHMVRVHSILGTKFTLKEYVHASFIRGWVLLEHSVDGQNLWKKLHDKAIKAEMAALASMTPHQRRRFERFVKLESWGEKLVAGCLLLGILTCGMTLLMSLTTLWKGGGSEKGTAEILNNGQAMIISIISTNTSLMKEMRELAQEKYNACVADAEFHGVEDPATVCATMDNFLDSVMEELGWHQDDGNSTSLDTATDATDAAASVSPLRSKINSILMTKLGLPSSLANYLTSLRTQTIAYLASFVTFLLFLLSHYLAHKLHMALLKNDPMKHFVLSSDATVKADGTVEAKRGETEAQRKRRERMMQAERMKAQMAQLAMEAKQAVEARRQRLEGDAAVEKEKEEEQKRQSEEREEIVKMHSKQFMMIKAGVPEMAIMNTLLAEGIEDESERKEIIDKLRVIKNIRAEEAQRAEEAEAKRKDMEKKQEEEKEVIAKERLRMAKAQKGTVKRSFSSDGYAIPKVDGGAELKKRLIERKSSAPSATISSSNDREGSSSSSTTAITKFTITSSLTDTFPSPTAGVNATERLKESASLKDIPQRLLERKSSASSATISSSNDREGSSSSSTIAITKSTITSSLTDTFPSPAAGVNAAERLKESASLKDIPPRTPSPPFSRRNSSVTSGNGFTAKSHTDTTPKKANILSTSSVTCAATTKHKDEENKTVETALSTSENSLPLPSITPAKGSHDENGADGSSDSRSSPPPILVRIASSPDVDDPQRSSSSIDFNAPLTSWAERPSALDILATITAVENSPNEEEVIETVVGNSTKIVDLSPSWLHTPAFERAVRISNASWDRRPSSRDVIAKIRAVELLEAREEEKLKQGVPPANDRPTPRRGPRNSSGFRGQQPPPAGIVEESLGIINEGLTTTIISPTSFDVKQKVNKSGSEDDEISELSEPTFQSLEQRAFKGRNIPQSLYVPQSSDAMAISPMVSSASLGLSPYDKKPVLSNDKLERMARMAEEGTLRLPAMPNVNVTDEIKEDEESTVVVDTANRVDSDNLIVGAAPVVESEEQTQRRLKAEARAKKIEAIAARRNAGEDDDESAVSGLSKRLRTRRKKKVQLAPINHEDVSVKTEESQKSDEKQVVASVKAESEEEKQRRMRAEARAKKLEAIAAGRNSGLVVDDDTAVSGISKRHRIRRKKSALAAITPEERERNEWKKSVYGFVMDAEQVQWRNSIYSYVLNAETTHAKNMEAKRELEEQTAAAQRRRENKERMEQKAKKFAARAERFHKSRLEGGAHEDGGSVVSSASISVRRRHHRKSTARQSLVSATALTEEPVEVEPALLTEVEKENLVRNDWCVEVYASALNADQSMWKKVVFKHVLNADEEHKKRMEIEAKVEKDRVAALALKEKERKNELRSKKMEQLKLHRGADASGEGASKIISPEEEQDHAAASTSAKQKWKTRRKKAVSKNENRRTSDQQ